MSLICPECGAQVPQGAKRCPRCGTPIFADFIEQASSNSGDTLSNSHSLTSTGAVGTSESNTNNLSSNADNYVEDEHIDEHFDESPKSKKKWLVPVIITFVIAIVATAAIWIASVTAILPDDVPTGTCNGHEYVDLGLPSGTKWATCNIGAENPEDCGDYFAWGETATKREYTRDTYRYSGNPTTLPSSADAAAANWGNGWRMPTKTEFEELLNNCTWQWTTRNGVDGYLVTGTNGNSIFLPAAGGRYGSETLNVGSYGYCWSSSVYDSNYACYLYFNSDYHYMFDDTRSNGLSVRAVCQ